MPQRPMMRKLALMAVACGLTLYSAMREHQGFAEATPVVQPARMATSAAVPAPAVRSLEQLAPPAREHFEQAADANLFVQMNWQPSQPPPPPVIVKPAAPLPPQAPTLPFTFIGMLEDPTKPTAFLAKGDALSIVSAGDTVDENYRIDAISSAEITLTYLPLNQRQHLQITGERP